jgi:hypothetical protein
MEDQEHAIDLLIEALHACQKAAFSRNVWEAISAAIDNAYDELEND